MNWVSVDDALPEPGVRVLVWFNNRAWFGSYDANFNRPQWWVDILDHHVESVTWWAEILNRAHHVEIVTHWAAIEGPHAGAETS